MFDREKIAELFRERRKSLKMKLEDLADDNVSVSTISNIERAVTNVTNEKIIYLGNKLGLRNDDLPDFSPKNRMDELEDIKFEMFTIESHINSNPSKALSELEKLNLPKEHPLNFLFHFLSGKCYFSLKEYSKSEIQYLESINILQQQSLQLQKTNIISASYYELSRIVYYKNNIEAALKYTQDGLDQFIEDGDKQHYRDFLLTGKSVYLEKLSRLEESMKDLEFMKDNINMITSTEAKLLVFEQRSKILKKFSMFDDAKDCAREGIRLAMVNKAHDRELDLWTLLGEMHLITNELDKAEKCYLTALELKGKFDRESLFITTYTQLGLLYIKQNKWTKAQEILESAVSIGQKTKDGLRYTDALVALGDCLEKQEQFQDAIQTYKKALKIAQNHKFISHEQELNHKLGTCYKIVGDLSNYRVYVDRFFEIGVSKVKEVT